ncbi:MAG: thioredoxin [Myxococcales bacterium]|nr:thioredoxin [Myxococcales bacterium]
MAESKDSIEFTSNTFDEEVLQSDVPVLVDFWAPWCAPCRMIAPHVEALAVEYAGRAKVGKLDTDQNREIAQRYGITSIPALIIFKDGRPFDQLLGAAPKANIQGLIDKAL